MKYTASLDGVELGEITLGDIKPNIGDKVRLRANGEPQDAFIHTMNLKFTEGSIHLVCFRPETWMKGGLPDMSK